MGKRPAATGTVHEANPLTDYLKGLREVPLLTHEQEIELSKRVERGDVAAKTSFIEANQRLVIFFARRYRGRGLSFGDLVQEGRLGLIRAVERFDWRDGTRFSTYASRWITGAIARGFANEARTVRTSPLDEPIAREAGEGAALTLHDIVEDPDAVDPEEAAIEAERNVELRGALETLTPEERRLISLRYGFEDGRERTPEETAQEMGLTQEQVLEIEQDALQQLQHRLGTA